MNQEKLFINVLTHPVLDKPEEKEILQEDQSVPAVRIPMSLSQIQMTSDNK